MTHATVLNCANFTGRLSALSSCGTHCQSLLFTHLRFLASNQSAPQRRRELVYLALSAVKTCSQQLRSHVCFPFDYVSNRDGMVSHHWLLFHSISNVSLVIMCIIHSIPPLLKCWYFGGAHVSGAAPHRLSLVHFPSLLKLY